MMYTIVLWNVAVAVAVAVVAAGIVQWESSQSSIIAPATNATS